MILTEQNRTALTLALNAFSSIGIVYVNKVLFNDHSFKYGTLLTVIHFFITSVGLWICSMCGVFTPKPVPLVKILPLCLSFCGFVALTNVSLLFNTIGFYQLIKVLTTPLLVIIQTFWYGKTFSLKVKVALAITCVGVALATMSDTSANRFGTVVALSALLITCMYQIWVGTKQTELQCDSFQLLFNQAPISCVMLIPLAYFADDLGNQFFMPCWDTIGVILFSGVLAFLVNISIFLVIGKTSPVTYNVLGHFKLCVILSLGFLLFGDKINLRIFIGIVLTLTGVFWYTQLKLNEAAKEKEETKIRVEHEETVEGGSDAEEKTV